MVTEKQLANLKPCKKGETHNPNGRPKKLVNMVLDELQKEGYKPLSASQVKDIYEIMIILPKEKLVEIGNDEHIGMVFRIIAKGILGNKGFEIIEKMLDRAQGKPVNKTDIQMEVKQDDDFNIVISEMRKEILEARKKKNEIESRSGKEG